jgi:hypothetical protein
MFRSAVHTGDGATEAVQRAVAASGASGHADIVPSDEEPSVVDKPCVFQCRSCKSVVGDTASLVAAVEEAGVLALSTASCVSVAKELRLSRAGPDSGCTFHALMCQECQARLGCVYRTTSTRLDLTRGLFSFQRKSITSYQLGSGLMAVDASSPEAASQGVSLMPGLVGSVDDHEDRLTVLEQAVRALGSHIANMDVQSASAAAAAASSALSQASASTSAAAARAAGPGEAHKQGGMAPARRKRVRPGTGRASGRGEAGAGGSAEKKRQAEAARGKAPRTSKRASVVTISPEVAAGRSDRRGSPHSPASSPSPSLLGLHK